MHRHGSWSLEELVETGGGRFGQCGYVPGGISDGVWVIQKT